jgi:hypothetical protein
MRCDFEMEDYPQTLYDAVNYLFENMPEVNLQVLKSIPEDELPMLHFTLGQWIRNNFGLADGENQKLLYSCAENSDTEYIYPDIGMAFIHPDDASMIIIQALWTRLQGSKLKK